MGVQSVEGYAGGRFQPEVTHQLLPGCPCGTAHPLALRAVSDKTVCPGCKEPAQTPGLAVTQVGKLTGGPTMIFATAMMAVGRFLGSLSRKV